MSGTTAGPAFGTNWQAVNGVQGSPGLDPDFASVDTASFGDGNVTGQTTQTVNLDGANPSLLGITFNSTSASNTSYKIATGTGSGSITLNGTGYAGQTNVAAGDAYINDYASAGTQEISANIFLATNADVNVNSGQTLTISGNVSDPGFGMNFNGTGTTVLSGANTYTGPTNINNGTVLINGSTLSTGAVTVASGANLGGTGSTGLVTINSGGNINLQDRQIGTLTVHGLSLNGGGALTFEISGTTFSTPNATDEIADLGSLSISGVTNVNIADVTGSSQTSTANNYALLNYATGPAASAVLTDLHLNTGSLDGENLSLTEGLGGRSGQHHYLTVTLPITTTPTSYTLATTASLTLLHASGTTTLTTTLTNTGTATTADRSTTPGWARARPTAR